MEGAMTRLRPAHPLERETILQIRRMLRGQGCWEFRETTGQPRGVDLRRPVYTVRIKSRHLESLLGRVDYFPGLTPPRYESRVGRLLERLMPDCWELDLNGGFWGQSLRFRLR